MKFVPSFHSASAIAEESSTSTSDGRRPSLWRRIVGGRQTHAPSPTLHEIQSKPPDWVEDNPEIKQELQIDLVETFNLTATVYCVKFSPDGKYLGVGLGNKNGKTYIYDVENGLEICCFVDLSLEKNQPIVWCVQFSPDNKYIATASSDRNIRIWEIAHNRTMAMFQNHRISANALCFSPNGRFLVAGDGGGSVRIWSLRVGSSRELCDAARNIFAVSYSPDGRHIAAPDYSGWLRIWDARTGVLLDKWEGHADATLCVAFSPDGKGLVSGAEDRVLRYWDVSSLGGMESGRGRVIDGTAGQRFPQIRTFEGHRKMVRSVSFSPDYRWIATGSQDGCVRVWDPHTGTWQWTLYAHDEYVRAVDFSPRGSYLASGGDHLVRVWKYSSD